MNARIPFGLLALVGVAAASAVIVSLIASPYIADVLCYAVVLALFSLAVGLTFGQLGYVSFGHAAFLGVGAYAVGLLVTRGGMDYWAAVPLAMLPGAALGALVGLASVRLGGAYFAIATLTLAEMLRLVATNWMDVTRGPLGMMVMVKPLAWTERVGWSGQQGYLFVLLVTLGVAMLLLSRLRAGPLGRIWTFVREAPALAESVGIPTLRARVINIALSGALAALAGGLLVPKALVLSPDLFGVQHSAAGLLAVILGGRAALIGPVIGGLAFGVLPEVLRAIDEYRLGLFAVMLLVVVRLLPDGIMSLVPWRRRRVARESAIAVPGADDDTRIAAPAVAGEAILASTGIGKRFGGLVAVDKVDVRIDAGELLGIIGPNGAGKTTLLSMLSGFMAPTTGAITLLGQAIDAAAPHRVARRGLVRTFQQTAHCASLTAYDNVLFASYLLHRERPWAGIVRTKAFRQREQERHAHAARCLAAVGLGERADAVAGTLPYGEQKLLGVAVALAAKPRVLLLDEPAAGLNHTEGMRLAGVLRRLQSRGCTIAIIDHNLPLLMSICDRIVVLQHGRKIADDAPAAIAAHPEVLRAYLGTPAEADPAVPESPALPATASTTEVPA
jgi:branched-chain amino acid transport system permease protein